MPPIDVPYYIGLSVCAAVAIIYVIGKGIFNGWNTVKWYYWMFAVMGTGWLVFWFIIRKIIAEMGKIL